MAIPYSIERVSACLRRHRPAAIEAQRRASVALILASNAEGLELLFIRRAEHPADPWSGQMALPGGRRDETDDSDWVTVLRETREEVGIALERQADFLGQLDPVRATARGAPLDMAVFPFVFHLTSPVTLVPSPEVAAAFWIPIGPLVDGSADARLTVRSRGSTLELPAWRLGEDHVWGLTYRMVRSLFDLVRAEPFA